VPEDVTDVILVVEQQSITTILLLKTKTFYNRSNPHANPAIIMQIIAKTLRQLQ
jgi:hypothetical protein